MFSNPIRLIGLVAGVAGLLAIAGAAAAGWSAFSHMKAHAAAYGDCLAIAGESRDAPSVPPLCNPKVAGELAAAVKAAACDDALVKGPAGAFAMDQACSAPVKRLVAERDAARSDAADRDHTIDKLLADRSAAVARAEARGLAQTQRDAHATQALQSAPRDAGGRLACDADCLSVLAGDQP